MVLTYLAIICKSRKHNMAQKRVCVGGWGGGGGRVGGGGEEEKQKQKNM